jgi:hypothetical protein
MKPVSPFKLLTGAACAAVGFLGCGRHSEELALCPEGDISNEVAPQVAAVRPTLSADFIYFVSAGSPARIKRTPRLGGESEVLLELDSESRIQALALQNDRLFYLDGGRSAVFQISIGEPALQERALQRDQTIFPDSSALSVTEDRVYWANQTDTTSVISSTDLDGADPQQLARVEDGSIERLVVTSDRIFASVLGSASARVISAPLDGGAALTIAELACRELEFSNGKLYCGSADSLYQLHPSGEAPQLLLEVPHVTAGAVADGAWYALVEWQQSRGGSALTKRVSANANTAILTCFQTSPTSVVLDQRDIYWLSLGAEGGEAYSLRHLAR